MRPARVHPWLSLVTLLLACGSDGDGAGGPPPAGTLTIEKVRPPDGSTQADPLSPIVVSFDAAVAPATVTADAFPLTRDGAAVPATAAYDAANRSAVITAPLLPGASYGAAVETTVEGDGGEQLDQRFAWSFATRPWEATPLEPVPGSKGLAMTADPDGRLHLLFWTPAAGGGEELRYATCATQCLVPANWTAVTLDQANSGGPVAILADFGALQIAYQNGSIAKLFYATCNAGCTTAASWQAAQLDLAAQDGHEAITLAGDATGRVHLGTVVWNGSGLQFGVAYATCAAACTTPANWQSTTIAPDGSSPSLLAEPTGRVHLVYRDPAANTLRYATCGGGCEVAGNWSDGPVDLTANTFTATALAMDAAGALHTAYLASGGVRYASCAGACDQSGGWQSTAIADAGDLRVQIGLALGETGRVHVIYGRSAQLEYATCVSECVVRANWQVGVGLPAADVRHLSLVRDLAGGLHLAFEDILTFTAGYAE
jgi:hypothetical protein